ncbi:MAG: hypothetical protein E6J48_10715 [Chloroflexi bacterium]|nr:MAG: hypothetical protein E6J48_10715 [Chloroflexota bacterium]
MLLRRPVPASAFPLLLGRRKRPRPYGRERHPFLAPGCKACLGQRIPLQTYQVVGKCGLCGSTGSLGLMPVESLAADLPAGRFAPLVPVVRRPASFPSFLGLSSPLGAPG